MNHLKTTGLLVGLTLLFIFIGQLLGGNQGVVIAFIMASIMNLGAYWFSDKIVLTMYGAKEVAPEEAPELYKMVQELSLKGNLPMPKVYIIDDETPNAFATGRNPQHAAVAITRGIMRILNREELSGVLGHELAHVQNRDTLISTIAATIAGAISMLANMAQWAMIFGGFGSNQDEEEEGGGAGLAGNLIMIIIAPIAAMLIQMAISRSREYLADEGGARLCGNPLYLASALRKIEMGVNAAPMVVNPGTAHLFIVNPLSGGGVFKLFSTHPPIEDRVARLEAMASQGSYL
jgi:heat shock protein HtpX